ncbi:MAG: tyrosine-protein phosphatase [Burkholderiaceae bacterium]|nr:tyrosine-protein phosphatase [Aquabacterium sp.]NUP85584.1 tyrosine-protein phosphatase [Burkholderiaceae bacterium]
MVNHPDRARRLVGATNFRDLGGYLGVGGRPVRWRRLYRSDHLGGLTDSDRQALQALGIRRSFDFRGVTERAAAPYDLPGLVQHSLSIEPTVAQRIHDLMGQGQSFTPELAAEFMRELYRGLVDDQSHRFAEFFEHLLASDDPVVFHCTAGKDRTGFAAALILLALGVPREQVMQDYLLTNELYRHPPLRGTGLPPDALRVLWLVQPDFLQAALTGIDAHAGGIDGYLQHRLGLGPGQREELAQRYLE